MNINKLIIVVFVDNGPTHFTLMQLFEKIYQLHFYFAKYYFNLEIA